MNGDLVYQEAKKRVKHKKDFYGHLTIYCIINVIMFFVVFLNGGGFAWLIPGSFWGMGLLINYFSVFGLPGRNRVGGAEWEARELRSEIMKMGGTLADIPEDKLELKEIQMMERGWDESELV